MTPADLTVPLYGAKLLHSEPLQPGDVLRLEADHWNTIWVYRRFNRIGRLHQDIDVDPDLYEATVAELDSEGVVTKVTLRPYSSLPPVTAACPHGIPSGLACPGCDGARLVGAAT